MRGDDALDGGLGEEVVLDGGDGPQQRGVFERVGLARGEDGLEPERRDDVVLEEPDVLIDLRARAEVVVDVRVDAELRRAERADAADHERGDDDPFRVALGEAVDPAEAAREAAEAEALDLLLRRWLGPQQDGGDEGHGDDEREHHAERGERAEPLHRDDLRRGERAEADSCRDARQQRRRAEADDHLPDRRALVEREEAVVILRQQVQRVGHGDDEDDGGERAREHVDGVAEQHHRRDRPQQPEPHDDEGDHDAAHVAEHPDQHEHDDERGEPDRADDLELEHRHVRVAEIRVARPAKGVVGREGRERRLRLVDDGAARVVVVEIGPDADEERRRRPLAVDDVARRERIALHGRLNRPQRVGVIDDVTDERGDLDPVERPAQVLRRGHRCHVLDAVDGFERCRHRPDVAERLEGEYVLRLEADDDEGVVGLVGLGERLVFLNRRILGREEVLEVVVEADAGDEEVEPGCERHRDERGEDDTRVAENEVGDALHAGWEGRQSGGVNAALQRGVLKQQGIAGGSGRLALCRSVPGDEEGDQPASANFTNPIR